MTITELTSDTLVATLEEDEAIPLSYAFPGVTGTSKMIPTATTAGTPQTSISKTGTFATIDIGVDDVVTVGMLKPWFRLDGDGGSVSFMRI
jgi:hypothetical protein